MRKELLNELMQKGLILQHYYIDQKGLPGGDWFVYETSPMPPSKEITMVIADIENSNNVYVKYNGPLEHLVDCKAPNHNIEKSLDNVISSIKNQKFRVAVWENTDGILNGQPVVIPLEPEINYKIYPDHPHINACLSVESKHYYLPESICYTNDPQALGDNPCDRIVQAIMQTNVWLFRHQVWLATRNKGKGIWLKPDVKADENLQIFALRNPHGKCRCGSNKEYYQCHLNQDFSNLPELVSNINKFKNNFRDEYGNVNVVKYTEWWFLNVKNPNDSMVKLKKIFH